MAKRPKNQLANDRTSIEQSISSRKSPISLATLDFETAVRAALATGTMPGTPKRKAKLKPKGKK
jgi:hypothetical protein